MMTCFLSKTVRSIIAAAREARWIYDWGGGLIWLATPDTGDAGAAVVRAAARAAQGYATLTRAGEATRNTVAVFEPPSAAEMKLTAGIKASVDPDRILNRGRMYAGV